MILIVKDSEGKIEFTIREAEIVRTYRNNSLGFWCVYRTKTGSNDGQFFVAEDCTLNIYH